MHFIISFKVEFSIDVKFLQMRPYFESNWFVR